MLIGFFYAMNTIAWTTCISPFYLLHKQVFILPFQRFLVIKIVKEHKGVAASIKCHPTTLASMRKREFYFWADPIRIVFHYLSILICKEVFPISNDNYTIFQIYLCDNITIIQFMHTDTAISTRRKIIWHCHYIDIRKMGFTQC